MSLFWRTWIAAISVILAIAVLLVTLVTLEFKRDYDRLLAERLLVIATSASVPFSAAAELGLEISGVRNASALLDIPSQTDPLISGVWVMDAQGRIVEGTGDFPAAIGETGPSIGRRTDLGGGWYATVASAFVVSAQIRDATAQEVGQLLVAYPVEVSRTRVLAMAAELSFLVLLIASAFSVAAGGLLRVFLAREIGGFSDMMTELDDFEKEVWTTRSSDGDAAPDDSLRSMLEKTRASYLGLVRRYTEQRATRQTEVRS